MLERSVAVEANVRLNAVLCLPGAGTPVPAILLIGGTAADTHDGDLTFLRETAPGVPGTLRRIAHRLAEDGIGSLRWDRRGFGASGGAVDDNDYETDLADALALVAWLRTVDGVDGERVGVAGHSAGALTACHVCRDDRDTRAAALLGGLASPIEDMLRWSLGRLHRQWSSFTAAQRERLLRESPRRVVLAHHVDELVAAAQSGEPSLTVEVDGARHALPTRRLRQDLATSYEAEFRHVRCPALVMHGGDDLNVPVADALTAYRALRVAGNRDVRLSVLPGLDHYFHPVAVSEDERLWEWATSAGLRRPMSPLALDTLSSWAVAALGADPR